MRTSLAATTRRKALHGGVALATAMAAVAVAAPASAAGTDPAIDVGGLDPAGVLVDTPSDVRYRLALPAGATLQYLEPPGEAGTPGQVLVVSADGALIGAFDDPVTVDAAGVTTPSTFVIDGDVLVQRVPDGVAFPVAVDPIYSAAAAPQLTRPGPPVRGSGDSVNALGDTLVRVPSTYVYNPRLGALHDYCTASPDEFPSPIGANANFRGPCARHDMCYGRAGSNHLTCDNNLYAQMMNNCAYYYRSWLDPNRQACFNTAAIYWAAVVVA